MDLQMLASPSFVRYNKKEKEALLSLLIMHELARMHLEKQQYSDALIILTAADNHKRNVEANGMTLPPVENYDLIEIDILWCFLHIGAFSELHEADSRLQNLMKKRGLQNGGDNGAAALKMNVMNRLINLRLFILMIVRHYLYNRADLSRNTFVPAVKYYEALKVSPVILRNMNNMGFPHELSRYFLRASYNDANSAINLMSDVRKTMALPEDPIQHEMALRLGRTRKGQWVNPGDVDDLVRAGFDRQLSLQAVKEAGNGNVDQAIQMLSNNVEYLSNQLEDAKQNGEDVTGNTQYFTKEMKKEISQKVHEMFPHIPRDTIRQILRSISYDIDQLPVGLLTSETVDNIISKFNPKSNGVAGTSSAAVGASSSSSSTSSSQEDLEIEKVNEFLRSSELIERLSDPHAAYNWTLIDELMAMRKYGALVKLKDQLMKAIDPVDVCEELPANLFMSSCDHATI